MTETRHLKNLVIFFQTVLIKKTTEKITAKIIKNF